MTYNDSFYKNRSSSYKSAQAIAPIINDLIHPKSVIDLGCATGEFLLAFNELGAETIMGVDGKWVNQEYLVIPSDCFMVFDLEKQLKPTRKYDLAISLEVAEHLSKKNAEKFIKKLTQLSDCVLFSAAIPFQGGIHHVNEQWVDYWVDLFAEFDFVPFDCVRGKVWNNTEVCWWYAQNTVLFVKSDKVWKYEGLMEFFCSEGVESVVHPLNYVKKAKLYSRIANAIPLKLRELIR
jgi:hypothetical protein